MNTLKAIGIVIVSFILLGLCSYVYFGGFTKVEFQIKDAGGETVVYEEMLGDYAKSGEKMKAVSNVLLNDYKMQTNTGCGIYYDNPKDVQPKDLRSDIGFVISNNDVDKFSNIKLPLKLKILSQGKYIVGEFPYKGQLSAVIGTLVVYPQLMKFIADKSLRMEGAVTEIYDVPNGRIIYQKEIVAMNTSSKLPM